MSLSRQTFPIGFQNVKKSNPASAAAVISGSYYAVCHILAHVIPR